MTSVRRGLAGPTARYPGWRRATVGGPSARRGHGTGHAVLGALRGADTRSCQSAVRTSRHTCRVGCPAIRAGPVRDGAAGAPPGDHPRLAGQPRGPGLAGHRHRGARRRAVDACRAPVDGLGVHRDRHRHRGRLRAVRPAPPRPRSVAVRGGRDRMGGRPRRHRRRAGAALVRAAAVRRRAGRPGGPGYRTARGPARRDRRSAGRRRVRPDGHRCGPRGRGRGHRRPCRGSGGCHHRDDPRLLPRVLLPQGRRPCVGLDLPGRQRPEAGADHRRRRGRAHARGGLPPRHDHPVRDHRDHGPRVHVGAGRPARRYRWPSSSSSAAISRTSAASSRRCSSCWSRTRPSGWGRSWR